jgi:exonuclease SbcD
MRFVHTSDWHLGHTLLGRDRADEHRVFLDELLALLVERQPDALLIAGDIFDVANPPASAVAMWFRFLLDAHRAVPGLTTIAIAGNHDSGARLDAPKELLAGYRVHVVGAVPRTESGEPDARAMLVPVRDRDGRLLAEVAAVPYLRALDLPHGYDALRAIDGVRALYAAVFAEASGAVPLLALGHAWFRGGRFSVDSERAIQIGHLYALPDDVFPASVAYAALGHLHLAQHIAGRPEVRYAGSPLPLALSERGYRHQVIVGDIEGSELRIESVPMPRPVAFHRIPAQGALPLGDLLRALSRLQDGPSFLEVAVEWAPDLRDARSLVDAAVLGSEVRAWKLRVEGSPVGAPPGEVAPDLPTPRSVLDAVWAQSSHDPLPDELAALLAQIVEDLGDEP